MKPPVTTIMLANGALYFFGAVQHAGISIGPFPEPLIIPAAIVEVLCGIALLLGVLSRSRRGGLIANSFALAGVLLGVAALAAGAGPRTHSNDVYHGMMLVMILASFLLLRQTSKKTVSQEPQR